jgi:hypothetical protein
MNTTTNSSISNDDDDDDDNDNDNNNIKNKDYIFKTCDHIHGNTKSYKKSLERN